MYSWRDLASLEFSSAFEVWKLIFLFFVLFCQAATSALGPQTPLESVLNRISRLCVCLADTLIWPSSAKAFYTRWAHVFFTHRGPNLPYCSFNSRGALISIVPCYRRAEHAQTTPIVVPVCSLWPARESEAYFCTPRQFWRRCLCSHPHSMPNLFQCLNRMSE